MPIQHWCLESADYQPGFARPALQAIAPTILLVEDDPAVRGLLLRLLRRQGYLVIEAADGRIAKDLAQQTPNPFDLLLTDVIMPNLNGVDLAQELRAQGKVKAVLFITGFADELLNGTPNEHVLYKPFAPSTLLAWIEQILGQV
ncbi:MAG: response regulator [Oscillochloridaceae bacterium umkhey_bin13]